jgi:hypothetical protein
LKTEYCEEYLNIERGINGKDGENDGLLNLSSSQNIMVCKNYDNDQVM